MGTSLEFREKYIIPHILIDHAKELEPLKKEIRRITYARLWKLSANQIHLNLTKAFYQFTRIQQ